MQELSRKRDFASAEQAADIPLIGDWEERVKEYRADLRVGIASLSADPQDLEDQQEIFE